MLKHWTVTGVPTEIFYSLSTQRFLPTLPPIAIFTSLCQSFPPPAWFAFASQVGFARKYFFVSQWLIASTLYCWPCASLTISEALFWCLDCLLHMLKGFGFPNKHQCLCSYSSLTAPWWLAVRKKNMKPHPIFNINDLSWSLCQNIFNLHDSIKLRH